MPWTGAQGSQTFSRTNGSNTGDTTWQKDDAASTGITSPRHDTHDQDIADAISACLKNDGGNTLTSNIPAGGFKLTNVGDATARTQFASFGQLQDGATIYYRTVGGTADAITLTDSVVAITAYSAGQRFLFKATATSTSTTPTVNIDGVGLVTITRNGGGACSPGDIRINAMVTLENDGTNFQLTGSVGASLDAGAGLPFYNPTAPTGWTKQTNNDDFALRIVTGSSGGSSAGTSAFSDIFKARTISAANVPDLTITVIDPGHAHVIGNAAGVQSGGSPQVAVPQTTGSNTSTQSAVTGISAAFGSTARGGAQTAMDFAVKYMDMIICVKN